MPAAVPGDERAAAIELYRTVGPLEAARRTGFADLTIRNWAHAEGVRAPRHGNDWTAIEECSDADAAYLAGIIDGEGSISVTVQHGRYATMPRYLLEVVAVNTSRPLIDWLQVRFGGNVSQKRKYDPRWRPCWRWRTSGLQAEVILKRIRPFLIVKAVQADLALEFRATFDQHHCRFRMPAEGVVEERQRLKEAIGAANRGESA